MITTRIFSEQSEHTVFEGTFLTFMEAEDKAWEEAQRTVRALGSKED
jgi:hypothetical protein